MRNCNQCGKHVSETGVSFAFNAGYGPVYVCRECAPPVDPKEAEKIIAQFIKMVEKNRPQS